MKASFVIVNYNRKDELLSTISRTKELIKTSSYEFEIVIVDNASTDGSAAAIKQSFPDVALIENPVNTGAPAWNLGFAKATGEYFVVLDDDSHIEHGLDEAIKYLDQNNTVGILALNITGGLYQTTDWSDMSERAGFVGCGAIFRKALYDKIGGYPEWMFLYTNEWDLGLRTLNAGYKIIYFKQCLVKHRASPVNRTSKRLIVYSVAHELALTYKYFSKDRWKYFVRIFFNNMKRIKGNGLKAASYVVEGTFKFLKLRSKLPYTPVSSDVQDFFTERFVSTHSLFIKKADRLKKISQSAA